MNLTLIAGARPNFMKIAPIIHEIEAKGAEYGIKYQLVHTGQHYDKMLSDTFFEELNIPVPDINLNVGSGTQAEQTANIMVAFEKYILNHPTDLVIVVGDVNSTMACSIVAKKLQIPVAHIEAGIRSFDLTMPEEINRMVTDSIADFFFTTSDIANNNLRKSGINEDQIFLVGNIMIDSLVRNIDKFKKPPVWDEKNLKSDEYFLVTLHRPSNVDDVATFNDMLQNIVKGVPEHLKIVFPVHPRTRKMIDSAHQDFANIVFIEPLGYLEFMYLLKNAKGVITDSGGIQEESTFLSIPCLTFRENTERPETITIGTNELIGKDYGKYQESIDKIVDGNWKKGGIPPLWDGKTAERIIKFVSEFK